MTPQTPPRPNRPARPWTRRLVRFAIVTTLLALLIVAGLPWLLSTPPARRWLVAKADAALAPGRLQLGTLEMSWFRGTRMTGFVLVDPQG